MSLGVYHSELGIFCFPQSKPETFFRHLPPVPQWYRDLPKLPKLTYTTDVIGFVNQEACGTKR